MALVTNHSSEQPLPDEDHLRMLDDAEMAGLRNEFETDSEVDRQRQRISERVARSAGWDQAEIAEDLRREKGISERVFKQAQNEFLQAPYDIEELHRVNDAFMESLSGQIESTRSHSGQGYITSASNWGFRTVKRGEAQEEPGATASTSNKHINAKTQAWGSGPGIIKRDRDYSQCEVWLGFKFRPSTWGNLGISVSPWLHGYYSLYANDRPGIDEHARVLVYTWVHVHQNYWRPRQSIARVVQGGPEIHPTLSRRVDYEFNHQYFTQVGASDTVTIRVGVRLESHARASGSHAIADFFTGNSNYIYVPGVYWTLHQINP